MRWPPSHGRVNRNTGKVPGVRAASGHLCLRDCQHFTGVAGSHSGFCAHRFPGLGGRECSRMRWCAVHARTVFSVPWLLGKNAPAFGCQRARCGTRDLGKVSSCVCISVAGLYGGRNHVYLVGHFEQEELPAQDISGTCH